MSVATGLAWYWDTRRGWLRRSTGINLYFCIGTHADLEYDAKYLGKSLLRPKHVMEFGPLSVLGSSPQLIDNFHTIMSCFVISMATSLTGICWAVN